MAVLVFAEHDGAKLKDATRNAIAAAAKLDSEVHVLVAGSGCRAAAEAAAKVKGVAIVKFADDPRYAHPMAETLAPLAAGLAKGYAALLAPATTFGKNVLPRVAALLDVQQISDIVEIIDADTFVRPIYAGNAMATVKSADAIKVITVRGTAFDPAPPEGGSGTIEPVAATADPGLAVFVGHELSKLERPELTSAKIIISGGRGM